ncbi:hypothetical protein Bca101_075122 [Brassica carinata]
MLALSVKDIREATGSRRILSFASLNLLHTLRQIGSSAFLCRSSPPPPLPSSSSSSRLFSSTGRDKVEVQMELDDARLVKNVVLKLQVDDARLMTEPILKAASISTAGSRRLVEIVKSATVDSDYSSRRSSSYEERETIVLPGCDYNHWLIVGEQIIDTYINTFSTVLGRFESRLKFVVSCSSLTVSLLEKTKFTVSWTGVQIFVTIYGEMQRSKRRSELGLLPSVASYFKERAIDVLTPDYEPSDLDILYAWRS